MPLYVLLSFDLSIFLLHSISIYTYVCIFTPFEFTKNKLCPIWTNLRVQVGFKYFIKYISLMIQDDFIVNQICKRDVCVSHWIQIFLPQIISVYIHTYMYIHSAIAYLTLTQPSFAALKGTDA